MFFIDIWIMNKFNVLPTDKRFISLYKEQKLSIFKNINMSDDPKEISKNYRFNSYINKLKKKKPEDVLSKGMISRMKDIMKAQGLDDSDIYKKIRNEAERMKVSEIKKMENLRDA